MGYTHYWTQRRDFTKSQWADICADIGAILKFAQHEAAIALANGAGDGGTAPEISTDRIWLNGVGDDSHETFAVNRKRLPKEQWQSVRGSDFCKTARKPYDPVVVACLCYLATVTRRDDPATGNPIMGSEAFSVSSDGDGSEWLAGLELARKAVPAKANTVDLPMKIMQADRWCAPWVDVREATGFEVHFCIDGRGYVLNRSGESYCFESHAAMAQFLERTKLARFKSGRRLGWGNYGPIEDNIWNAMGSFDVDRHARIRRAQATVLAKLFPVDPACAKQPPAYVRPGEMPANAGREFCYNVSELLALGAT